MVPQLRVIRRILVCVTCLLTSAWCRQFRGSLLLKNVPKITGEIVRNLCHQLRVAAEELPNWVAGANTEVDPKVAKTVRYGIVALMNDCTIVGPSFNIPGVGVGGGIEANICAEMGLTAKLTALKLRQGEKYPGVQELFLVGYNQGTPFPAHPTPCAMCRNEMLKIVLALGGTPKTKISSFALNTDRSPPARGFVTSIGALMPDTFTSKDDSSSSSFVASNEAAVAAHLQTICSKFFLCDKSTVLPILHHKIVISSLRKAKLSTPPSSSVLVVQRIEGGPLEVLPWYHSANILTQGRVPMLASVWSVPPLVMAKFKRGEVYKVMCLNFGREEEISFGTNDPWRFIPRSFVAIQRWLDVQHHFSSAVFSHFSISSCPEGFRVAEWKLNQLAPLLEWIKHRFRDSLDSDANAELDTDVNAEPDTDVNAEPDTDANGKWSRFSSKLGVPEGYVGDFLAMARAIFRRIFPNALINISAEVEPSGRRKATAMQKPFPPSNGLKYYFGNPPEHSRTPTYRYLKGYQEVTEQLALLLQTPRLTKDLPKALRDEAAAQTVEPVAMITLSTKRDGTVTKSYFARILQVLADWTSVPVIELGLAEMIKRREVPLEIHIGRKLDCPLVFAPDILKLLRILVDKEDAANPTLVFVHDFKKVGKEDDQWLCETVCSFPARELLKS